jgi:hypothetical protein
MLWTMMMLSPWMMTMTMMVVVTRVAAFYFA